MNENKKLVGSVIKNIFFALSFLPYVLLSVLTVYWAFFGEDRYSGFVISDYAGTFYGWETEALWYWLLALPFFLFHVIAFAVNKKNKTYKKIRIVACCLVLVLVVVVSIAQARVDTKRNELIEYGKGYINEYLISHFGEDEFSKMTYKSAEIRHGDVFANEEFHQLALYCELSSPLVKENFHDRFYFYNNEIIGDGLADLIIRENQYIEKIEKRAFNSHPPLPSNVEITMRPEITNFYDVYNSSLSDDEQIDLFEVEYHTNDIRIRLDEYDKGTAVDTVKNIYLTYNDILYNDQHDYYVSFYIDVKSDNKDDGSYMIFINGYANNKNDKNKIELQFKNNRWNENPIEEFTEIIDIE